MPKDDVHGLLHSHSLAAAGRRRWGSSRTRPIAAESPAQFAGSPRPNHELDSCPGAACAARKSGLHLIISQLYRLCAPVQPFCLRRCVSIAGGTSLSQKPASPSQSAWKRRRFLHMPNYGPNSGDINAQADVQPALSLLPERVRDFFAETPHICSPSPGFGPRLTGRTHRALPRRMLRRLMVMERRELPATGSPRPSASALPMRSPCRSPRARYNSPSTAHPPSAHT